MDDTVLKMAMAGYFHDVGKFADGRLLGMTREYQEGNEALYQPVWDSHYSHSHALHTAWFVEGPQTSPYLPSVLKKPGWGEGDSFINLAAAHHKPESPMQSIITIADRLSSGMDRESYEDGTYVKPWDYRNTRLLPIFEQLLRGDEAPGSPGGFKHAYPLAPMGPESIFPGVREDVVPDGADEAKEEYQRLLSAFLDGLKQLRHANESTHLWFEHFDSLVLRHTWCIPQARAGKVLPDVSLYDHMRTTSALATALFAFHKAEGTLEEKAIHDEDLQRFLIVSGDFYGIQDFILKGYGDTRKLRSKLLRGRSFSVSLFCELAADLVLRKLGLPFSSCIYNAAGRFTIMAPNTAAAEEAVNRAEQEINDWFFQISHGQSGLGLARVPASSSDFVGGKYSKLMKRVANTLERKKCQRLDIGRRGGAVPGYLESFSDGGQPCPLCGIRPCSAECSSDDYMQAVEYNSCSLCRDQVYLGTKLPKEGRLAVLDSDAEAVGRANRLMLPVFGRYQISFGERDFAEQARSGDLLHLWDIALPGEDKSAPEVTLRHLGGHVPLLGDDSQDPRLEKDMLEEDKDVTKDSIKTFSMIASMARRVEDIDSGGARFRGVRALGVLKADVDDLGKIMAAGLPRDRVTMSRIATLSRQFHYFFAVYLPNLLATDSRFNNIYTVFAGGDDLFLIGPWNRVIELALYLDQAFAQYVCRNPSIHFSAGITLHGPNTPLSRFAEAAEEALERSKSSGKRRLTIFGATAPWDEASGIRDAMRTLEQWMDEKRINLAFLYRLDEFMDMAAAERRLPEAKAVRMQDLACTKWHALLAYAVERNVARDAPKENRQRIREEVAAAVDNWLGDYGDAFRMAVWTILYNNRRR